MRVRIPLETFRCSLQCQISMNLVIISLRTVLKYLAYGYVVYVVLNEHDTVIRHGTDLVYKLWA